MDQKFCQSCGMPLNKDEDFGLNADKSKNEEYCLYCFTDGKFTQDLTMDQMIERCADFVDEFNKDSEIKYTREEAVVQMKAYFPKFEALAKYMNKIMKGGTQDEYEKAVNKAIDYINNHLFETPDVKQLSLIANISKYHFHRIFKSIIGENIGEYINRIRLEYIAEYLQMTRYNLDEIALKTGYGTKHALSKAFKKHFGVTPSAFRSQDKDPCNFFERNQREIIQLTPDIREVDNKRVVYIRIIDQYGAPEAYRIAWQKLGLFAKEHKLIKSSTEFLGLSFDNPTITLPKNCRFYACFTIDEDIKPQGSFGIQHIEGGLYAIFTLKGPYSRLWDMYYNIYMKWLPKSNYKLRKGGAFEKYLNNPDKVSEDEILTEIYVPVCLKNR